jgi:hypothetical protein
MKILNEIMGKKDPGGVSRHPSVVFPTVVLWIAKAAANKGGPVGMARVDGNNFRGHSEENSLVSGALGRHFR